MKKQKKIEEPVVKIVNNPTNTESLPKMLPYILLILVIFFSIYYMNNKDLVDSKIQSMAGIHGMDEVEPQDEAVVDIEETTGEIVDDNINIKIILNDTYSHLGKEYILIAKLIKVKEETIIGSVVTYYLEKDGAKIKLSPQRSYETLYNYDVGKEYYVRGIVREDVDKGVYFSYSSIK
ncbi:MAG: hypothetical protein ABIJ08_06070 [Nanoarchaeota archaeon]